MLRSHLMATGRVAPRTGAGQLDQFHGVLKGEHLSARRAESGAGIYVIGYRGAATRIPRGAIVGDLTHECEFLTADEYQTAQRAGDRLVIQRAVHAIGALFVYHAPTTKEIGVGEELRYSTHEPLYPRAGVAS